MNTLRLLLFLCITTVIAQCGMPREIIQPISKKYRYVQQKNQVILKTRNKIFPIWKVGPEEFKEFRVLARIQGFDYIYALKYDSKDTGYESFVVNLATGTVFRVRLGVEAFLGSYKNKYFYFQGEDFGLVKIELPSMNQAVIDADVAVDVDSFRITDNKIHFSGQKAGRQVTIELPIQ